VTLIIIAHHEAAHSVVQYRLTDVADSITILPAGDNLGCASDSGYIDSTEPDDIEARILSVYAAGHAQRRCEPGTADDGCDSDDALAADLLQRWQWTDREQEFRDRARDLVDQHWTEIVAVATELVHTRTLDC
jgi:hypothetical protein